MTEWRESPQQEVEIPAALRSYRDTAPQAFTPPPAASIAARAMQRRQRRIVAGAGAAVLAVVAGVAGVAGMSPNRSADVLPIASTQIWPSGPEPTAAPSGTFYPGPTYTPEPLTSPKNFVIAPAALLRPQDIGPGYTAVEDERYGWMQEWGLRAVFQGCPHLWPPFAGPREQRNGDKAVRFDGPNRVSQHVGITNAAQATWLLDGIRKIVIDCTAFEAEGRRFTLRLMEEGFAGDQSMLVELVIKDGFSVATRYHAVAREGAAYTEIAMAGNPAELKTLATGAVERMCRALPC